MKVGYKRGLNGNCMILEDLDEVCADKFALQMILKNKIPGLLDVQLETFNNKVRLSYDISSKQALDKMFEAGKMKRKHFKSLISSLRNLNERLSEYLLDTEYVMALPEYIYTNIDRDKFYFCYNPFYEGHFQTDLGTLADNIVSFIDYDDAQLVKSAYELNALVQRDNFSINELISIIDEIEGEDEVKVRGMFEDQHEWSRASLDSGDDIDISEFIHPENNKTVRKSGINNEMTFDSTGRRKVVPEGKTLYGNNIMTEGNAREQNALRKSKKTSDESFVNKLKIYLKGRKLKEIIDDIDNGVILDSIDMCYKRYKKGGQSFDLPLKGMNQSLTGIRNVNNSPDPAVKSAEKSVSVPEYSKPYINNKTPEKIIHMNMDIDEEEQFCRGLDLSRGPENGTILLKESPQSRRKLIGTGTQHGNVHEVNRYPFLIGKIAKESDLILPEPSVSRMHAKIYKKSGQNQWELEDLNSTNGTFVNGTKLEAYTKQIIKPGDLISIADQEFVFR